MSHITEMMPNADKWPEWAKTAFKEGNFFETAVRKIEENDTEATKHIKKIVIMSFLTGICAGFGMGILITI